MLFIRITKAYNTLIKCQSAIGHKIRFKWISVIYGWLIILQMIQWFLLRERNRKMSEYHFNNYTFCKQLMCTISLIYILFTYETVERIIHDTTHGGESEYKISFHSH